MGGQNGSTGGNIVISRRLVIGMLGAGAVAFAHYAAPVALAFSPEARTRSLMKPFGDSSKAAALRVLWC